MMKRIFISIFLVCALAFTFNTASASDIGVTVTPDPNSVFTNTGTWTLGVFVHSEFGNFCRRFGSL